MPSDVTPMRRSGGSPPPTVWTKPTRRSPRSRRDAFDRARDHPPRGLCHRNRHRSPDPVTQTGVRGSRAGYSLAGEWTNCHIMRNATAINSAANSRFDVVSLRPTEIFEAP